MTNEFREILTEGIIPILGMLLSFFAVGLVFLVVTKARQRRIEIQAELQSKLIDKFGTTTELITFLESPAGRKFVQGVQTGNVMMVQDRVVGGIRRAILITALGVGFIALWIITGLIGLAWPGVLLLVLGIGYYAASMVTMRFGQSEQQSFTPRVPESTEVR